MWRSPSPRSPAIAGGNFRLLQRLFAQINRIAAINDLDTVTRDVVGTARESLIMGAACGPQPGPGGDSVTSSRLPVGSVSSR